ncbi:MAG: LysR family pca operon transcriptional activator, partial [Celeribacter sp.]
MIDSHIRMRHLRCFLETARLGSLSAAADAMHVSQPAASKTIRELEDILGVPLFDRTGRRLVLSAAGKVFQQHAGAAMIDLKRAQDLVRDAPRSRTRLAVGTLPTAAT